MNNKENLNQFITRKLNDQQRLAVCHVQGPLLVIAGPGSGKTGIITARIAHLIAEHNVPDNQILALTFTNKAAKEMKQRVQAFMQKPVSSFVGTFHGYCLQLLKRYASYLPYPQFSIIDSNDQQALISSIIKRSNIQQRLSVKGIAYKISTYKNTHDTSIFQDNTIKEIYIAYEEEKRASNCFDFDDLLLEVLALLKRHPQLALQHYQQVQHILVDEYQDTNTTQHNLLKLLSLNKKDLAISSVCVVGDQDQSIYSWRGATVENMQHFQRDFYDTHIIKIEQNYRSVQPILSVANAIIQYNNKRVEKHLWSEKKASDRVRILECFSSYQEADAIAQAIKLFRHSSSKQEQTKGILYRAHYQSRAIEEALIRQGVTYTIIGGIQFYERKEIKDILAYLRLLINPYDKVSFFRVINCPLRGLGDVFQQDFHTQWLNQLGTTYETCVQQYIERGLIKGKKAYQLSEFCTLMHTLSEYSSAYTAIQAIIQRTHYTDHLYHVYEKEEADEKVENIKELLRSVYHQEQQGVVSIEQFLHEVALLQQNESHANKEPEVVLMTLHSAKGLEFDFVVLCGLEEGVFPSNRSTYDQETLQEERRLFYVGITRAKEYLLLCHAQHRSSFGTTTQQYSSRFLDEIPRNLVNVMDITHHHNVEIRGTLSGWLNIKKNDDPVITFTKPLDTTHHPVTQQHKDPKVYHASTQFKINRPVQHKKFGTGIIKKIETRSKEKTLITVSFKQYGIKKIESSFLQSI